MDKKVAVVTGSSSGIGAATARLFASNGYNVVINFSRDAGPANAVGMRQASKNVTKTTKLVFMGDILGRSR